MIVFKNTYIIYFCITFFVCIITAKHHNVISLDERWICHIKQSCLDCLRLAQCSWCPDKNRCFSDQLPGYEDFCEKKKIRHTNYGMSLEDDAKCSCSGDEIENNCQPPGSAGPDCSDRGTCICGRCVCDSNPDPENPSKMVVGEYCEYDNFSCDGPKCNEGPYSIHDQKMDEDNDNTDMEQPVEH